MTLYLYSDFLQDDFDYSICTDAFQVYLKSSAVLSIHALENDLLTEIASTQAVWKSREDCWEDSRQGTVEN